jgi:hypothetical protein
MNASSVRSVLTRLLRVAAPLLAAASLGAQPTAGAERLRYVRVVARDYAFDAPPTVGEGIVVFALQNQGEDVHHLALVELGVGHTPKEFFDALRVKGVPPAWAPTVGATPTIQKNGEAFLTLRLAPGRYVLSCMIPAKDGRSHVEKGMYQLITVTAAPSAAPAKKKP